MHVWVICISGYVSESTVVNDVKYTPFMLQNTDLTTSWTSMRSRCNHNELITNDNKIKHKCWSKKIARWAGGCDVSMHQRNAQLPTYHQLQQTTYPATEQNNNQMDYSRIAQLVVKSPAAVVKERHYARIVLSCNNWRTVSPTPTKSNATTFRPTFPWTQRLTAGEASYVTSSRMLRYS